MPKAACKFQMSPSCWHCFVHSFRVTQSHCVFIVTLNWKRQFFNLVSLRLHEFSPQALVLVLPSNIYLCYHDRRSQCRNSVSQFPVLSFFLSACRIKLVGRHISKSFVQGSDMQCSLLSSSTKLVAYKQHDAAASQAAYTLRATIYTSSLWSV